MASDRYDHYGSLLSAKKVFGLCVLHYQDELAHIRANTLRIDRYGNIDGRRWSKQIALFFRRVILPRLSVGELRAVSACLLELSQECIEEPVRLHYEKLGLEIRTLRRVKQEQRKESVENQTTEMIASGLIIRPEPLDKIMRGVKTWEMRSVRTTKRGTIALIEKGRKHIVGVADIVDCLGPLSDTEMVANYERHKIEQGRLSEPDVAKWRVAYVLNKVKRLRSPIPCPIRSGAVTFVSFDEATGRSVLAAMKESVAA